MIRTAKVSVPSIQGFTTASNDVVLYSEKLNRGINCLEELSRFFSERVGSLKECVSQMNAARTKLAGKKSDEEKAIASLEVQLNALQDQLSEYESELDGVDESVSITDENGEEHTIPNPAYLAIEAKISAVKSEIYSLELQIAPHKNRLERIKIVDNQLAVKCDSANGIVYALEEKQNSCVRLMEQLENIKAFVSQKGTIAVGNLKKIIQVVNRYLRTKMTYDRPSSIEREFDIGKTTININININKNASQQETVAEPQNNVPKYLLTKEYINEHRIKFDEYGRISEYEGKRFGGKYNPYDERVSATLAMDTILGTYDGERGESMFIPSERTVDGIKVKQILEEYDLEGIVYRNAEPDFEPCSEAVVRIPQMTENRWDYYDENGNQTPGNFSQASEACANLWSEMKKNGKDNWSAIEVDEYRRLHKLTWHEKADTETMVLVRTEINDFFKHIGGVSECKKRDSNKSNFGGEFDE